MFTLMTYDIPSDAAGTKRRNKLYHLCKKYGYHVQNSVFEFDIDYAQLLRIEHEADKIINHETDSVRIYKLGKERTEMNVVCLGRKEICESNDSCFMI